MFFETAALFRRWLRANGATAEELVVGFHKVGSGRPSLTWPESVDEALAFGWIDGVRKRIDEHSYQIRFTPRRPGSIWSAVNIAKVEALEAAGRMTAAGRAAFARRTEARSAIYAYEQRHTLELAPEVTKQFKKNTKAWRFFEATPPSYRKLMTFWIMSARQPATRERRVARLIAASAEGRRL